MLARGQDNWEILVVVAMTVAVAVVAVIPVSVTVIIAMVFVLPMSATVPTLAAGIVAVPAVVVPVPAIAAAIVFVVTVEAAIRAPAVAFSVPREWAAIAKAGIVVAVDVAVEVTRAAEPGAGSDEDSVGEPCGAVVAIRRTVVGRIGEVSVRANRLRANVHREGDL